MFVFGLTDTDIVYFNEYFGFRGPPNDLKEYWPTVYTMDQLHNMVETKPYDSFPNEQKIDMLNSYRAHAQEKAKKMANYLDQKGRASICPIVDVYRLNKKIERTTYIQKPKGANTIQVTS